MNIKTHNRIKTACLVLFGACMLMILNGCAVLSNESSDSVTIVGKYVFPPPGGISGDTTTIQITTDDEGTYSVQVNVGDEMIESTIVSVTVDDIWFYTEVSTPIGDLDQVWKVQRTEADNDKTSVSILSGIDDEFNSVTLKGTFETD